MTSRTGIVEIFRSVQGEGYNAGRAAIFVRFAGCNLSCVFGENAVCDTPYQHSTEKLSFDALVARVHALAAENSWQLPKAYEGVVQRDEEVPMLILTGGEPTMQPKFDDFVHAFHRLGFYVAVETNGTRWRESFDLCDWISCSPKTDVQQGSPMAYHNPHPQSPQLHDKVREWLKNWSHVPRGEYRYVVSSHTQVPFSPAFRHYVSPAVTADGSGQEWKYGFPGFAPGALEQALRIIESDPRWRLSLQAHKITKQR
jgi:7-carboxy-7-deazaguanine synthase